MEPPDPAVKNITRLDFEDKTVESAKGWRERMNVSLMEVFLMTVRTNISQSDVIRNTHGTVLHNYLLNPLGLAVVNFLPRVKTGDLAKKLNVLEKKIRLWHTGRKNKTFCKVRLEPRSTITASICVIVYNTFT